MPAYGKSPNLIDAITDIRKRLTVLENQQNGGVSDGNGVQRLAWGLLPGTEDYGFAVTDALGTTTTEILPVYESNVLTPEATASTSYADLATPGPTVTAVVGTSGQVLVTVNSYVGTPSGAGSVNAGYVGVSIDGAAPVGPLDEVIYVSISTGASGAGIAVSGSASVVIAGLSPGSHTFGFKYKALGGSATFDNRFLQVRPL